MLSATSHIGLEFLTKFLNMSKLQNRLILLYQSLPLHIEYSLAQRYFSTVIYLFNLPSGNTTELTLNATLLLLALEIEVN